MKIEYILNMGFKSIFIDSQDNDLDLYYSDIYKTYIMYQKSTNKIGVNKKFTLKNLVKFTLFNYTLFEFRKILNKNK